MAHSERGVFHLAPNQSSLLFSPLWFVFLRGLRIPYIRGCTFLYFLVEYRGHCRDMLWHAVGNAAGCHGMPRAVPRNDCRGRAHERRHGNPRSASRSGPPKPRHAKEKPTPMPTASLAASPAAMPTATLAARTVARPADHTVVTPAAPAAASIAASITATPAGNPEVSPAARSVEVPRQSTAASPAASIAVRPGEKGYQVGLQWLLKRADYISAPCE